MEYRNILKRILKNKPINVFDLYNLSRENIMKVDELFKEYNYEYNPKNSNYEKVLGERRLKYEKHRRRT